MAVNLSSLAGAGQQFFNDSGIPLSGGKLYSYAAGTTTPQTTYTSASGSTAHTNPIVLNSAGRVATGEIWLTAGSNYKFVLYSSTNVLVASWDNITGINGTGITSDSSNVSYTQGSSGTITTTVQARLRQAVSVMDFGAVGDGVTDDTAAIQTAINTAASAHLGELYVPMGTYKITSTITFPASPALRIVGVVGRLSSVVSESAVSLGSVFLNATNGTMFSIPSTQTLPAGSYVTSYISFENISFDQTPSSTTGIAVDINNGYDKVSFVWCSFFKGLYGATSSTSSASVTGTFNVLFEYCEFQYQTAGTYFSRGDTLNMVYQGNVFRYCGYAVLVVGGNSFYFYNNLVEACTSGGYKLDSVFHMFLSGDHFEQNAAGGNNKYDVLVTDSLAFGPKNLHVENCTFTRDITSGRNQAVQFRVESSGRMFFNSNTFLTVGGTAALQVDTPGGPTFTQIANVFDSGYTVSGATEYFVVTYSANTYVPTLTADTGTPSLGNGTIAGTYTIINGICTCQIKLTVGSTTTLGTGALRFGLPFSTNAASLTTFGSGIASQIGVSDWPLVTFAAGGSPTMKANVTTSASAKLAYNVPFTFAATDTIELSITYRV